MKDWPKNGADVAGALALIQHGYPELQPLLPDIVLWLKVNGPVREVFCAFLAQLGAPAIEPVRKALQGTHEHQIEQLMRFVLPLWPPDALLALAKELEDFLQRPSVLGLNVLVLPVLLRSGARTHAPIDEWARVYRRRLLVQLEILDLIEKPA